MADQPTYPLPDTSHLTPTQELIMEVLAARRRLGEQVWTFGGRHRVALVQLANAGYLNYKSGIVQDTYLAWMTDEGRAAAMDESYVPPASCRGCDRGWGLADNAHTRDERCQFGPADKAATTHITSPTVEEPARVGDAA